MRAVEEFLFLRAEIPALVQITVCADFEAALVDFRHKFRVTLGVEPGHEEAARDAVLLEEADGQHLVG